jgi:hypothetical protein
MKNMSFIGQPNYCISQDGKIFSLKSNRFLKHFHDQKAFHPHFRVPDERV